MSKILIATWIQHDNYGSLLQAYCLKKILEDITNKLKPDSDSEVQINLLNYCANNSAKSKHFFNKNQNNNVQILVDKLCDKMIKLRYKKYLAEISKAFDNFRKNELALFPAKAINSIEEAKNLNVFDLYIAGSDQIWNPKLLSEIYLLSWTPKNKPKFSYAPSICVEHLSKEELEKYKVLKSFRDLSVRERNGAVVQIEKEINKKIYEVADPVILYGRKRLLKFCRNTNEEYIFTYLLGNSKKTRDYCLDLAKICNLDLKSIPFINMNRLKNDLKFMKGACWSIGPLEFVNLVYNSSLFITDSFHGLIIALLLHKDFIIVSREEDNSEQNNRIYNLLKQFNLDERFGMMPQDLDGISAINWNLVDSKIEKIRDYSFKYLNEALSIL